MSCVDITARTDPAIDGIFLENGRCRMIVFSLKVDGKYYISGKLAKITDLSLVITNESQQRWLKSDEK